MGLPASFTETIFVTKSSSYVPWTKPRAKLSAGHVGVGSSLRETRLVSSPGNKLLLRFLWKLFADSESNILG